MLTDAQKSIVTSLAGGHSACEIARERNVKLSTVYTQMGDARERTGARTTHELVAMMVEGKTDDSD